MINAERPLTNVDGALEIYTSGGAGTLVAKEGTKVVEAGGAVGVDRAEHPHTDG